MWRLRNGAIRRRRGVYGLAGTGVWWKWGVEVFFGDLRRRSGAHLRGRGRGIVREDHDSSSVRRTAKARRRWEEEGEQELGRAGCMWGELEEIFTGGPHARPDARSRTAHMVRRLRAQRYHCAGAAV